MDEAGAKRIFFAVNARAGNGRARRAWQRLLPRLETLPAQIGWQYTSAAGEASNMVRKALDEGYDTVIAVGGDGTLHEALNGYLSGDAPYKPGSVLGFWPLGTGCDTARAVYKGKTADYLLEMLKNGRTALFDVGKCGFYNDGELGGRYFINSADTGLGADVVAYTNTHSKALGGKLSFLIGALVCLLRYDYCPMKVWADGELFQGRYLMAAVGNGQYFGGGMRFVPQASFTDGKLDLLLADKAPLTTILPLIGKIYKGGHVGHPIAHIRRCERVTAESERPMLIELDGESVGYTRMEIGVLPAAVKMLVPADFDQ